jgi:hypothetical protein
MATIQELIDNHIITSRTPENMAQYEFDQIKNSLMGEPRDPDRKYSFEIIEKEFDSLKRFGFEGLFNLGKNYLTFDEMECIIATLSLPSLIYNLYKQIDKEDEGSLTLFFEDNEIIGELIFRLGMRRTFSGIL